MTIFLIFTGALALITLLLATYAALSGAPWVPAFKRDVQAVLDDAGIKAGDTVIELGCGDGRLLHEAAQRGAVVTGYEINPLLWLIAFVRLRKFKGSRVMLRNFWAHNLKGYDVVITFLVPRTTPRLEKKVMKEMKKGSRLVSYIFPLPHKKPVVKRHHWFVYEF